MDLARAKLGDRLERLEAISVERLVPDAARHSR